MVIKRFVLFLTGGLLALSALYLNFTPSLAQSINTSTWYTVVNQNSGSCVDDSAGGTANGTAVQQWACVSGSTNQQWQFQSTSNGNYKVVSKNNTSEAWDVTGVSTSSGALIQLWAYGGGANQQWTATALDSTHYKFVSVNSGLCLDVPSASTANGVQLQQYTCNGTAAQSWSLVAVGGSPTNTPTVQPPTNTPVATSTPVSGEAPYGGTRPNLPGTVQAENYDTGGQNVGYSKPTAGTSTYTYRSDANGQIETTTDTGGGADVGWTNTGDWYRYMVNVTSSATYNVNFRIASANATGGNLHLEVDGNNVTGSLAVPGTGGWQTWQTITASNISLSAGNHTLRLYVDAGGMNINWISVSTVSNSGSPWGGTAPNVPGKILAANFNTGGEGVAYHDVTNPRNNTTNPAFRTSDGVDLENCSDSGCGYDIGWTEAGEWENYTVNVTTAGTYSIDFRVASGGSGGALHLEIDGNNVTGSVAVPGTGGWQTWTTVTKSGVNFSAGQHVLRLYVDTAGYNIWYFNIYTPSSGGSGPLPKHIVTGYWQDFTNGATNLRLRDVPTSYTLIAVAFAVADPNNPGGETFNVDSGLSSALGGYSNANFISDVQTLHSQGRKVIISIGGAGAGNNVTDSNSATNFANSVYGLMQQYGFDGVDIDLESGITVSALTSALQQLSSKAGPNLIIAMAPQTIDMQNTSAAYFQLALNIKNILTVVNMQFYNSGTMLGCNGQVYAEGTEDFLTALACIELQNGLRPDQVGLGLPAQSSAGNGYVDPSVVNNALDCLETGANCGSFVPPQHWTGMRGAMDWSINWDGTSGYNFANTVSGHFGSLP